MGSQTESEPRVIMNDSEQSSIFNRENLKRGAMIVGITSVAFVALYALIESIAPGTADQILDLGQGIISFASGGDFLPDCIEITGPFSGEPIVPCP